MEGFVELLKQFTRHNQTSRGLEGADGKAGFKQVRGKQGFGSQKGGKGKGAGSRRKSK